MNVDGEGNEGFFFRCIKNPYYHANSPSYSPSFLV